MARLSKHGQEIGRVQTIQKTLAYFANGDILENYGQGWKILGKVKPGVAPETAYQNHQAKIARIEHDRPVYAEYRRALMGISLSKRWKFIIALQVLGDDIDGIWSETCDGYGDNISLSVEEIGDIVRLKKLAEEEKIKAETNTSKIPHV